VPASWATAADQIAPQHNGSGADGHKQGQGQGHGSTANDASGGLPASFLRGKFVRTVYGLVPLKYALDWPVFASYDDLNSCAAWMGGRIPTLEEARSIYTYAEFMKTRQAENQLGATVPAVNG
jgi:L-histidine Nalpha-methyltransferase / hercynylcysteine S-oxide synthase